MGLCCPLQTEEAAAQSQGRKADRRAATKVRSDVR